MKEQRALLEKTYNDQLKQPRAVNLRTIENYKNEQRIMSCLVHSMGAKMAYGNLD
jgi:hypothetical protein